MKRKCQVITLILISIFTSCSNVPDVSIIISPDAGRQEKLAAKEIRKYFYQRTGEILTIATESKSANKITLSTDALLAEDEFLLQTNEGDLTISGGSPQSVLYGAYELAEQLGVRFYLHGDVVPDKKVAFSIPELNIKKKPLK